MKSIHLAAAVVFALGVATGVASAQEDLPPGHPAVKADDDQPADAPPNPHQGDVEDPHAESPPDNPHGQNPHGGGNSFEDRIFHAPPDDAVDDPALKGGSLIITVRDARDQPVASAPLTIDVLHSTVAKGDSRERLAKTTDAKGQVSFEALQVGAGTSYRISSTRGPATFSMPPLQLGDKVGKRAVLHVYEPSSDFENLLVLAGGIIYVHLRQDAIEVQQLVQVENFSPMAWVADLTQRLPEGYKAFNRQETTDEARVEDVAGTGYALRGTFAPGRHDLEFTYQIPLDGTEKQTIRIGLMPHTVQGRVMVEAGKAMAVDVASFPPAERVPMNGKKVLITERMATRGEGGVRGFDLTISGLPTPGPGRWVAVVLATLAVLGGIWTVVTRDTKTADPEALDDLKEAREALLGEIVTLERLHKAGEIGPKTYARVRASLLDALARVVDQIEKTTPKKKRAERAPARGAA